MVVLPELSGVSCLLVHSRQCSSRSGSAFRWMCLDQYTVSPEMRVAAFRRPCDRDQVRVSRGRSRKRETVFIQHNTGFCLLQQPSCANMLNRAPVAETYC